MFPIVAPQAAQLHPHEGSKPDGHRTVESQQEWIGAGEQIGVITSGLPSPTLGQPIAMGYIQPDYLSNGQEIFAQVRKQAVPVQLADMPFVAHNYKRAK